MLVFFLLLTDSVPVFSQPQKPDAYLDSVEISLLTCGPRPYVYSLYGHTAIRYKDPVHGNDLAINYGLFSFGKPFFILRFVFGLTDYEMGIEYFSDFVAQYAASGCGVRQQVLNLTNEEKKAIADAIYKNYEPQNRVYRYNYFYDNCTTRARDIILNNVNGRIKYDTTAIPDNTFREMIHKYNTMHRWARFGNDLLLGVKADRKTTRSEQQFLPDNTANDFATAEITARDGKTRNLVTTDTWILPRTHDVGTEGFPVSPTACFGTFAIVIVALTLLERVKRVNFWMLDAIVLFADGICGLILLAMVFSQHPTVNLNLQILLLNPLSLAATLQIVKYRHKQCPTTMFKVLTICIILFLIGGFLQSYAEGMYFVALSLLVRYIFKIYTSQK